MSNFADNLRNAMFFKRCKAADVARATKITPSVISRYLSEAHQPSTDNLLAISKYLGISPEALLSSSEAPESSGSSRYISSDKDKIIAVQEELIKNLEKQVADLEKALEKTTSLNDTIKDLIHLADQLTISGYGMSGIVRDKKDELYLAKIGGMEKLRTKVELMKARFFTEEEIRQCDVELRNVSIVHELQNYPKRGRPPKKKPY